ncbi:MAG: hypothetical protein ACR2RB_07240, partial [Gammaproteobacteria bacterium]
AGRAGATVEKCEIISGRALSPDLKMAIAVNLFVLACLLTFPVSGAAAGARFPVCHGYSCRNQPIVHLNEVQWSAVLGTMQPAATTPTGERQRLAHAIAKLESTVGVLTGVADLGGNAITDLPGQMDCIDESTNTTTYLRLLDESGLLRWHEVEERAWRSWWGLDIHWTAVIRDHTDGQRYAVDSWFLDNGMQPYIQPLRAWRFKRRLPYNPDALHGRAKHSRIAVRETARSNK